MKEHEGKLMNMNRDYKTLSEMTTSVFDTFLLVRTTLRGISPLELGHIERHSNMKEHSI